MRSIGHLPNAEGIAIARISGAANRVSIGTQRGMPLDAQLAELDRVWAETPGVDPARRPWLLGWMLGTVRANALEWEKPLAAVYVAAGADEDAAAEREQEYREWLGLHRGGPRD